MPVINIATIDPWQADQRCRFHSSVSANRRQAVAHTPIRVMFALPPKADMCGATSDVR